MEFELQNMEFEVKAWLWNLKFNIRLEPDVWNWNFMINFQVSFTV